MGCEYRGGPGPGLSFSGWQDLIPAIRQALQLQMWTGTQVLLLLQILKLKQKLDIFHF